VNFLVDAPLPRRLAELLRQAGFDAIHTLDLPLRNRTPDTAINELSVAERRIVVTKDADFIDSLVLRGLPWKLLLVSTGNISNSDLMALFFANLDRIATGFDEFAFIEINRTSVVFHL
jgi:predicted nuclease of predicted toxin-antitoxin system